MGETVLLTNIFHITATFVLILVGTLVVYVFYLLHQLQQASIKVTTNARNLSKQIALARYSIQANLLKKFLSFIDQRGGVKYGEKN